MKAIVVAEAGDAGVLKLQDIPTPQPAAGEALVRMTAAGINFSDIYMRRGTTARYQNSFPFTPGREGAGIVESVASDVTSVKPGDRVAFAGSMGSYAEYNAVNAAQLVPVPDFIPLTDAAGVMLQGMTAHYLAYDICPVHQGDTVLIHAAAGGVGLLCIALLKRMGVRIIGTVSNAAKAAIAREAGADHIINYTTQDFAKESLALTNGRGVDYIMDGVGNTTFLKNLEAIRIRGNICLFGSSSGDVESFSPNVLIPKSISLHGAVLGHFIATRETLLNRANALFTAMHEGWLNLRIETVLPLEQAAEAHRLLESRQTSGKLILTIAE